jgi:hypothetical protein
MIPSRSYFICLRFISPKVSDDIMKNDVVALESNLIILKISSAFSS